MFLVLKYYTKVYLFRTAFNYSRSYPNTNFNKVTILYKYFIYLRV